MPRMPGTDADIVGVEQNSELDAIWREARKRAFQDEGLEEPARMAEVPLCRTCFRHGLQRAILGTQRLGKPFGLGPHRQVSLQTGLLGEPYGLMPHRIHYAPQVKLTA